MQLECAIYDAKLSMMGADAAEMWREREQGCGAVDDGRCCCGDVRVQGFMEVRNADSLSVNPGPRPGLTEVAICTATRCRWRQRGDGMSVIGDAPQRIEPTRATPDAVGG